MLVPVLKEYNKHEVKIQHKHLFNPLLYSPSALEQIMCTLLKKKVVTSVYHAGHHFAKNKIKILIMRDMNDGRGTDAFVFCVV